ncbi:Isopenicillin N synthase-like, Fe(2+) 2OG dioxygenase domain, partial [Dillenia turbinata]
MDAERSEELKAFDNTKAGVKGLVDAGIEHIPKMFIRPPDELAEERNFQQSHLQVPVIDLEGIHRTDRHEDIVNEIRTASETWGFFQVLNHGIPLSVLDGMIDGIRSFHEQDLETKKEFYSRDRTKQVRFDSNIDLYRSTAANWRDTLTISMLARDHVEHEDLPPICRDAMFEYINHAKNLGGTLLDLLSEALGLEPGHLRGMECDKGRIFVCQYYPSCPQPELTLGVSNHSDPSFLTILLQDQIGGLQVLHENQWVNVQPIAGALVINTGDLLQIISNDKFRSTGHRVVANRVGPRISTACFFSGSLYRSEKPYGPIKELMSEENPPLYREFSIGEFMGQFSSRALGDKSSVEHFK